MSLHSIIEKVGLVAVILMPFFNIPLILRVIQRKSSKDISMAWALGVWICVVLAAPSGFTSSDIVWKAFNYVNLVLFTAVLIVVLKYR